MTRPRASGTRRVPANIAAQILWDAAAETDPLPDVDRTQLGLLPDVRVRKWGTHGSACDQAAAAFYDPDRLTPGLAQATIVADVANFACSAEIAKTGNSSRLAYQMGRALLAKSDVKGARQQFELAVSGGYRAALIDLANLLSDASAGVLNPERAVSLYEQAWQEGVPIAAFELGHLYEYGVHSSGTPRRGCASTRCVKGMVVVSERRRRRRTERACAFRRARGTDCGRRSRSCEEK